MPALFLLLSTWLKHNVARTLGVLLISTLILSVPYMIYSKGHSVGYAQGYAKAIADRPTYGTVGTVVNAPATDFKWLGISFNIWKLRAGLGF